MIISEQQPTIGHRVLIGLLAILIGITPLICKSAHYYDFSNLPQSAYLQTISIVSIVLFLLDGVIKKQLKIKYSVFYIPIVGLLGWSFLSHFWATNIPEGLSIWLNWFAGAILFFVIYNLICDSIDIKIFLFLFTIPTIFVVLVGFNQYLETDIFNYPQIIGPAVTFGNKNMMIDALIPMMPIALYLTIQNRISSIFIKLIGALLYGAGVVLVVLSDTRSGMLAIAIQIFAYCILLMIFLKKSPIFLILKSRQFFIYGGAFLMSLILFYSIAFIKNENNIKKGLDKTVTTSQVMERINTIFNTVEEDKWALQKGNKDINLKPIADSRTMRLVTWQNTMVMFLDKPILGFGLFNWQIHYGEYRNKYLNDPVYRPGMSMVEVHNDYLQLLVDLGIVGFLFALILFFLNIQTLWRVISSGVTEKVELGIIISLGLLGIHLVALFSFPFERSVPVIMFFLFCAFLAFFRDNIKNNTQQKNILIKSKLIFVAVILFVIVLIGVIEVQKRRIDAELDFKASQDQHAIGNYELAIHHAKNALEKNPYRYTAYFLIGYSYLGINKLDEAEKNLLKGLEYYPNDLNSLLQIGTTYTKLTLNAFIKNGGENKEVASVIEKANHWFDKALKIREDFHTIYFNKGVVNWQRSVYAQINKNNEKAKEYKIIAIQNYKKSIEFNPNYIDGLTTLSQLLYENDQKKEAVNYAEKAANILISDFENAEKEVVKFTSAKVSQASTIYLAATTRLKRTRQNLVLSINKTLPILKNYYGAVEINYEKYLDVVLKEEKYFTAKEADLKENLNYAEYVLNNNKPLKDSDKKSYAMMERNYIERKIELRDFKFEYLMAMAILNLNKGEVYQNLKKYELAINALSLVLKLTEVKMVGVSEIYENELNSYITSAKLNLADIYCVLSTVDNAGQLLNLPKFMEYEPKIEAYLKAMVINKGDLLYDRYSNVITKFTKYKEVASKLNKIK